MKSKIQGLIPNILALSFIIFLIAYSIFSFINANSINDYGVASLALIYAVWIFSEAKTTTNEVNEGETQNDGRSLEFYASSRGITTTITLLCVNHFELLSLQTLIGMGLFVFGVCFRFYAINTLGAFYSHRVREKNDHQIINTGP